MTAFEGWAAVADGLRSLAEQERATATSTDGRWSLDAGQCDSIEAIADRIEHHGVLIADEVGMGKTRIAVAVARSVVNAGGRVAVLVPPGLGHQWQDELLHGGQPCGGVLRSLWQFLEAWSDDAAAEDRWLSRSVVLISHAFTNWRLGEKATPWRWGLLPELYAHWRRQYSGRFPNGYYDRPWYWDNRLANAAADIVEYANTAQQTYIQATLDALYQDVDWKSAHEADAYSGRDALRLWLECAVGMGLGTFDLVIVDEAHKSRGSTTSLSRLLDGVVFNGSPPENGRRLCMTATPVELESAQWQQTFQRLGVSVNGLEATIESYAEAVRTVRAQPTQDSARRAYREAADAFQRALSPYVIRRDKRQAKWVKHFHKGTGLPMHAYRDEREIAVDTTHLPVTWRQALCAAEALSLIGRELDDIRTQRLRLTIGNGHGLSAILDQYTQEEADDGMEGSPEEPTTQPAASIGTPTPVVDKGQARAQWWMKALASAFSDANDTLYTHPAILATLNAIDTIVSEGEKVLVFGTYTRPMRALTELLNARALLRHLDASKPWPQSSIADHEWPALQVAHRQLGRPGELSRAWLDDTLHQQYAKLENTRTRLREQLLKRLGEGIEATQQPTMFRRLYHALSHSQDSLAPLARALSECLGDDAEAAPPAAWASAFVDIIEAVSDTDTNNDDANDEDGVHETWMLLAERLHAEYANPQGGFARLMHGPTPMPTRRLLQLAFNRPNSFPQVLVAQSRVGREGLNLHRACRTVILMHPEWNPGVVEQQIGRVDRVGSWWEQQLARATEENVAPADWPRIRVLPVVFKDTYDEENWRVLRQRWDDLRAQLHGVVIPGSAKTGDDVLDGHIDEINMAAPSFLPTCGSKDPAVLSQDA